SSQYPTRALRPKNSVMSKDAIDQNGFMRLPNWKDALERYLKEIEVI
ncbi:MAG: sugar nucleotide-binding protein, partial [Crenarchaeota archaeon]|nr:sugar nucleotide-binding protein [Thermoproteota archaeon]